MSRVAVSAMPLYPEVVEVGEIVVGLPAQPRQWRVPGRGVHVAVAVEVWRKEARLVRLRTVRGPWREDAVAFVHEAVSPGSFIRTDNHARLPSLGKHGYLHQQVAIWGDMPSDRPLPGDRERLRQLLPKVHWVAEELDRWLVGTYHGAVAPEWMDGYLNEFMVRYNLVPRIDHGRLWRRLLQSLVGVVPSDLEDMVELVVVRRRRRRVRRGVPGHKRLRH